VTEVAKGMLTHELKGKREEQDAGKGILRTLILI
jgi:hypothetical protein